MASVAVLKTKKFNKKQNSKEKNQARSQMVLLQVKHFTKTITCFIFFFFH